MHSMEIRDALDTIHAAVANLRLYRERLTPEDFHATVRDIEDAAEVMMKAHENG